MLQCSMTRGASPTGGILPVVKDGRLRHREVLRDRGRLHQSHEPRLRERCFHPDHGPGREVTDAVQALVVRACSRRDVHAVPSGVVTAEALIWHHGYKGLDAALKASEARTGDLREDVRAEKLAADRYLCFKHADLAQRAAMLELWSRRRGPDGPGERSPLPEVVPASA
jgi:hypothetical protein